MNKIKLEIETVEIEAGTRKLDGNWTISDKRTIHDCKLVDPAHYFTKHRVAYEEPDCVGYTEIDVLPFLIGRKWDEISLAYVHALQPSCVRVSEGEQTLDSVTWRVNVVINNKTDRIIEEITQEVEVAICSPIQDGHSLNVALKYGTDSVAFLASISDDKGFCYCPFIPEGLVEELTQQLEKELIDEQLNKQ